VNDEGNSNIQVEITDPSEFHCFRLVFKPKPLSECCHARIEEQILREGTYCSKCGHPAEATQPQIEIMLHARSLVDLIHKCSLALCDWQADRSAYLVEKLTSIDPGGAS
jgi:hypothetical protein